jgi:hypothetical protein
VEECKGRDFLLMVLQEGGMEEMQKEGEKLQGRGSLRGKNQLTVYVGYVKWEHTDHPPCLEGRNWQENGRRRERKEKNQEQIGASFNSFLICRDLVGSCLLQCGQFQM